MGFIVSCLLSSLISNSDNHLSDSCPSISIQDTSSSIPISTWASTFKPRPSSEAVKNCTHVDAGVKEVILSMITDALLKKQNVIEIVEDGGKIRSWNKGGIL